MNPEDQQILDTAVVGAGVSGAYVAWRLSGADEKVEEAKGGADFSERPSKPIKIFERRHEPGGRLLSVCMPGTDIVVELGGMRYTSAQVLTRNLAEKFGLSTTRFEYPERAFNLRGHHLTAHGPNAHSSADLPYALPGKSQSKVELEALGPKLARDAIRRALADVEIDAAYAGDVNAEALNEKLSKLGSNPPEKGLTKNYLSSHEWLCIKEHGVLSSAPEACLYEIGFWNLLHHYLASHEAFVLLHDILGYESILANWNAADAMPWFLADFGVDYWRIKEGYATIPTRLAFEYGLVTDEDIVRFHELKGVRPVSREGEELLQLEFEKNPPDSDGPQTEHRYARKVVLALPKGALEELDLCSLGSESERERFQRNLESVTGRPLFKLYLGYESPWWRNDPQFDAYTGKVVTDLPLRQIYYWGHSEETDRAVLMASYSDARYVDFWKPLLNRDGRYCQEGYEAKFSEEDEGVFDLYYVSDPAVRKAHQQLTELHPALDPDDIPAPVVALVRDWSAPPFYGGWHSWNVHRRSHQVMREVSQPFDGVQLFICGEAYSPEQGWVEGALKSAELALSRMDIAPPEWVEDEDYWKVNSEGRHDYVLT